VPHVLRLWSWRLTLTRATLLKRKLMKGQMLTKEKMQLKPRARDKNN